jgi:hypothetical protein
MELLQLRYTWILRDWLSGRQSAAAAAPVTLWGQRRATLNNGEKEKKGGREKRDVKLVIIFRRPLSRLASASRPFPEKVGEWTARGPIPEGPIWHLGHSAQNTRTRLKDSIEMIIAA